ncbi:sensor histidine kinase [Chryseobacterium populi]|nr:histidine kinase [Chryseobacterium populi]
MKCTPQELKNALVIDFLVEDQYRILRHVVFLIFFFLMLFFTSFWNWYVGIYKYYVLFFVYTSLIIMVYVNTYILVPLYFFKTRYTTYFILLALMGAVGLNVIGYCFDHYFSDYKVEAMKRLDRKGGMYEGFMMCISIILISTTVKLLQKWTRDNKKIVELSNLTLSMELNELRNQINPHFLFNMLNNVKALIRTDPEKASAVIIKLSEFLRYQLYENGEEKTLLSLEIEFLSNFLNLEKIRRENFSFEIESKTDKRILNRTFIPPNLFTTFVENAVKHSVDMSDKESSVKINIEIQNQKLYFVCRNSRDPDYPASDEHYSGLGLANIKRRLELLYDDTHNLEIISTEKEYTIDLIIPV